MNIIFSLILSPFQAVSYIKCMIIVCLTIFCSILLPFIVFDYFLLNFVTISASELHKVHDYLTIFSLILSPFSASELHDCCVFDYCLFDFSIYFIVRSIILSCLIGESHHC